MLNWLTHDAIFDTICEHRVVCMLYVYASEQKNLLLFATMKLFRLSWWGSVSLCYFFFIGEALENVNHFRIFVSFSTLHTKAQRNIIAKNRLKLTTTTTNTHIYINSTSIIICPHYKIMNNLEG